MGIQSQSSTCQRKALIEKVRKVLGEMDDAKVEGRCCCTDPAHPPEGLKVVSTACLDGARGLKKVIPEKKDRYVWIPPPIDNRPQLDPSMSCYGATVASQFYDQYKGCRLDCVPSGAGAGPTEHSHWWNDPQGRQGSAGGVTQQPDYCEDPSFQPPTPLGHQAWSQEPGGICRYPQYCKAHCFDHNPERDWSRP
uniref:Uncharacterized protein n=1 Tax=Graphocephala atropunctata TaxID=36148 RepID=A0A1B6L390_9HEMI